MNHLKSAFLLIVPLIAMASLDANAFPIFCSDIAFAPDRVLTGCQFDGVSSNPPSASSRPVMVGEGASYPIDEMLSRTPKNRQLFHFGPDVIVNDQDGKEENDLSAGVTEKQMAVAVDADLNASGAAFESLHRDQNWYYMNIDQDGTHLFFGDIPEVGEPTTNMDDDDYLPDGIGIGKKWHF